MHIDATNTLTASLYSVTPLLQELQPFQKPWNIALKPIWGIVWRL